MKITIEYIEFNSEWHLDISHKNMSESKAFATYEDCLNYLNRKKLKDKEQ
jgi:hypothetical protein